MTPPWSGPSIYVHIRDNPNSHNLPDETRGANEISFAPGAWDGIVSHHLGRNPEQLAERLGRIERALEKLVLKANNENLKELYEAVTKESVYAIADDLAQRIAERFPSQLEQMAAVGRYFAAGADQREATKFGIILLSLAGDSSDLGLLQALAGHDEFTLFAAIALSRLVDDPEQCVWRLAQKVQGWGRVHLVERLDGTTNPEIQDWMLREGFRNHVMDNYLAEICARNGKLEEALQRSAVDLPLLDSAADLLSALLEGGPSAGIDDFRHAPEVVEGYLQQLSKQPSLNLKHFLTVDRMLQYLNDKKSQGRRLDNGWTTQLRYDLQSRCETILARESWPSKIEEGLVSSDHLTFHMAETAATRLGWNTWDIHFKRVQKAPLGDSWFRLMQLTNEANIDQVLAVGADILPLQAIATGPADAMGIGKGFEPHGVLDYILQELPRFPGRGWPFIKTGLQSPVVRNRNFALTALRGWPRESWPGDAFKLLREAERLEPNQGLKERMKEAIRVQ